MGEDAFGLFDEDPAGQGVLQLRVDDDAVGGGLFVDDGDAGYVHERLS